MVMMIGTVSLWLCTIVCYVIALKYGYNRYKLIVMNREKIIQAGLSLGSLSLVWRPVTGERLIAKNVSRELADQMWRFTVCIWVSGGIGCLFFCGSFIFTLFILSFWA